MPDIKLIPNADGKFDADSFIVIDPGLFDVDDSVEYVKITLDYLNKTTNTVEMSETRDEDSEGNPLDPFYLNIKSRKIDVKNPVAQIDTNFTFKNAINPRRISLQIEYPLDTSINDRIDNILIL